MIAADCDKVRMIFGPWGGLFPVQDFGFERIAAVVAAIREEVESASRLAVQEGALRRELESAVREALAVAYGKYPEYTVVRPPATVMAEILQKALGEGIDDRL